MGGVSMDAAGVRPRRWISGIEPASELLSATGTEILEMECRQQPGKLRQLICSYAGDPEIRSTMARLRAAAEANSGPVLFLGMGASFCSAISGAVFLQTHGRPAFFLDAGEWLHYGASVWSNAALSVLLTTSGESAELVELINLIQRKPAGALALICNN